MVSNNLTLDSCMVLRAFIALLFVFSALSAQARDVIIESSLGFVTVVDIDDCSTPHLRTYATTDFYVRQMASDPRGYVVPYLQSVESYDWYCGRPAYDYVLPIDYYVMGVKVAEIRLKVTWDPPWVIEAVHFIEGVEVPRNDATDFLTRTIAALDAYWAEHRFEQGWLQGAELSVPQAELEAFAQVDDGFSGRADVLELLAYLTYDVSSGTSGMCLFDKALMERAAEAGNTSAMFRLVECLNDGTSIDAIRLGHPGLSELSDEDYDKFRYYLAKALSSGYLPASLYVSHPIAKFQDEIPLDAGTIAEISEVVDRLRADPSLTFAEYRQGNGETRSLNSNAVRAALNEWFLANDCNWVAVADSAADQGHDMGVVGALFGEAVPTSGGWCMSTNSGTSILLKFGQVDGLTCTPADGVEQCSFTYRIACLTSTAFGDSSAGEMIICAPLKAMRLPGKAVIARGDAGKLHVLSFGNKD
ncbi:MAG: hypothetical protein WBA91_12205 [Paracoccaceae bacterium]